MEAAPAVGSVDVQPLLQRVADGMAVGELLAAESFNLHDAMQAIEIGDPKMDVGLRREVVGTPEELIAAGQAPVPLPPPQLAALLDRLLAMEATWHTGAMLPQTVFTSLYMLDTERLKANVVLHAYCVALRSTCTAVSDLVVGSQVCEDEDISVHAFGVRLDPPGLKAVQAAQGFVEGAVAWLESGGIADAAVCAALLARLKFRLSLLHVLCRLQSPSTQAVQEIAALCETAAAELVAVQERAQPEETVAAAPGFVPDINRRHMGLVPPRPVNVATLPAAAAHWTATLTGIATACRALLGVTCWPELRATLVHFAARPNQPVVRSVMHHLLVKPIPVYTLGIPAADALIGTAKISGAADAAAAPLVHQEMQYGPAARSTLVPAWCPSQRMLANVFGLPENAIPSGDTALFFEQCAIAVQGWCHTHCLNRCRQRRRLRRLLEDWRNMMDHAFNAEASQELQAVLTERGWRWQPKDPDGNQIAGPLAAWVEQEAAGTMVAYLQLGGPLELYSPHEYCSIYWYCDYLLSTAHQAHSELHNIRPAPPSAQRRPKSSAKGKATAGSTSAAAEQPSVQERRHSVATLLYQIDRLMCQGIVKMALGLEQLGLLSAPSAAFSSPRQRFHQRFACFAQLIRPEPLPYEDLQAALQEGALPLPQMLLLACDAFAKADRGVAALARGLSEELMSAEESRHLAGVRRIAAQNLMALKLLIASHAAAAAAGGGSGAATFRVSWDLKVAQQYSSVLYYPCLKLQSAGKLK